MWDRPSLSEWKAETGILPVDEYHDLDDWVWLRKHDEQDELSGSLSFYPSSMAVHSRVSLITCSRYH